MYIILDLRILYDHYEEILSSRNLRTIYIDYSRKPSMSLSQSSSAIFVRR